MAKNEVAKNDEKQEVTQRASEFIIIPRRLVDEMMTALVNAKTEIPWTQMNNFLQEVQRSVKPFDPEVADGGGK